MKSEFSYTSKLRVRYGETDQMGYCYYGNYAQYFEVGRVEAFRSLGMSYRALEEEGVMLPVSHFEVDYLKPALYDDELSIITTIAEVSGARIYFDYVIMNEKEQIVCKAKSTLVFVSKENMRPIAAPAHFMELIKAYETV